MTTTRLLPLLLALTISACTAGADSGETQASAETPAEMPAKTPGEKPAALQFGADGVPVFVFPPAEFLTETETGLKVQVLREGTGAQPTMASRVTVHYAGWHTDGQLFDSSYQKGKPFSLPLHKFVPGFGEGVATMKTGGAIRLVIPGELAYGAGGFGSLIGPNETLVFVVELVGVSG